MFKESQWKPLQWFRFENFFNLIDKGLRLHQQTIFKRIHFFKRKEDDKSKNPGHAGGGGGRTLCPSVALNSFGPQWTPSADFKTNWFYWWWKAWSFKRIRKSVRMSYFFWFENCAKCPGQYHKSCVCSNLQGDNRTVSLISNPTTLKVGGILPAQVTWMVSNHVPCQNMTSCYRGHTKCNKEHSKKTSKCRWH